MSAQGLVTPAFMAGCKGRIFTLFYPPQGETCRGAILHVPAFAEEMNKSRHMITMQARKLSADGYGVLVFDYYGTGDSEGDFENATWDTWQQDVLFLIDWLTRNVSNNVCLWGLRFGCLLAASSAEINNRIPKLFFWQPVFNGEHYMQQFLRLRMAANLFASNNKESTKSLKLKLNEGETLEVAGYDLSPGLFHAISNKVMAKNNLGTVKEIIWFDVNKPLKPLNVPGQKLISHWQEQYDLEVLYECVEGKQFWANQEIVYAEQLIDSTTARLVGYSSDNPA